MAPLFKELQPVDAYKIRLSQSFSDYDRQLLTLFYQPLIGPSAMSLFMTLWADAEREDEREYNHYHLMNILTMPLGPVFEARISLEAIGLLRTYGRKDGDARLFIYELLPPLDARAFFQDPLLSTFLFSKIGEQAYRNLRSRFAIDRSKDDGFEDVSRTFLDVYTPVQQGYNMNMREDQEFIGRNEPEGVPFVQPDFDFALLRSGLSEQMVPQAALSSVSKETISKLAFLYSLTPLDMQKVIMMALDEDLKLPEDRLRKSAAEFYKMNVSKDAPALHKVYAAEAPKPASQTMTRDEELEHYLENTAPLEMLRDFMGKEPLSVDVKLAEKLVNTHGLSVGVVNVLLQYVLYRNDGKITNSFAERIASHWMGKKVETVKAAMELSRNEHDQYVKWKNEGQVSRAKRKPTREEKVPEWFYKKEEKQTKTVKTGKPASNSAIDEERRKLLKELGVTEDGTVK
ncbi:replication initiation and membrane attachment family protein [Sporosarcina sp. JAI121]|uniref:replication initiation and membrane attachment family protein n=1 Tax=Sporosarcina sp. JAI121 TaxID=2723064 RepID=UPI0015C9B2AF|nr:DnaD domain protein [Sporosarcina sp. JAI121]NYF25147.1 replication initiation and membrane attachment protein [Sporosarcina sp. JAI121]